MANAVVGAPERAAERSDHQLVSAVRRGDDRAFEQLYSRYQRRIAAYVLGMVKDHGRAEDITQEVFVSALRRMRQTERPIAFKPWIYEIAKNACIDAYRRGRRAEEVSYDADDRLSPSDHVRLVATGPEPDAAVDAKQDLDHLCGAFGGLSDIHHEILVLRELEGLSYKDIGERMGMSRPAVESTLFRARKRLGEEYDELASGARCLRIQGDHRRCRRTRLGRRDQRRLARHVSHCQPCRRLAARAGLDVPVPVRRRVAEKIAGLLPLPGFLRFRRGGEEPARAAGWRRRRLDWRTLPSVADAMSSGWSKGAAGLAALALAGAGVGVNTFERPDKRDERGAGQRATDARSDERRRRPAVVAAPDRRSPPSARAETPARRDGRPARGGVRAPAAAAPGHGGARARGGAPDAGSAPATGRRRSAPAGGGPGRRGAPRSPRPDLPGTDEVPTVDAPVRPIRPEGDGRDRHRRASGR